MKYRTLISSFRAFSVRTKEFFSTFTWTTFSSSFCSRRFGSFKKLEWRSYSVITPSKRSAIELVISSWQAPGQKTDPLRKGDRGVPCWNVASGDNVRVKYFLNAARVTRMQFPASCHHSQSSKKAKLEQMFLQTGVDGLEVVLNVLFAALHVIDGVFLFYLERE